MGMITTESASTLKAAITGSDAPINKSVSTLRPERPLPDEPLVVIEPTRSWVALNLGALWTYRELLYFLMWRDVKVRYKQTALGAAWAIIQPLFTMLIFTLFFGKLAGIPSDGVPYALFAYAGLLPWTFLSNAVLNSSNSLVGDSRLITKIYFPRMVIPIAAVGAGLVDFAVASFILIGLMFYFGVGITLHLLMAPVFVFLLLLLAMGVGMLMAALNIKYRDVRYALPFLIQLWMFASPIIYPTSLVPDRFKWLILINPLSGIIDGFRSSVLGKPFDWTSLIIASALTLAVLIFSAYTFRRMEKTFADIV